MSVDEDLLRQLMASFKEELAERLAAINAGLLGLEQAPDPAQQGSLLEELFRHVHSLKGAARAVNLKPIEELAHGMEDVFGAAKRGSIQLSATLFDLLYQGLDLISASLTAAEAGRGVDPALDLPGFLVRLAQAWRGQPVQPPKIEEEPPPPVTPTPTPLEPTRIQPWTGESIRVPTARLDDLMAQTGELLVTRLRIAQQVDELHNLEAQVARWQRDWQRVRGSAAQLVHQAPTDGAHVLAFLERNEEHLRAISSWLVLHSRRVSEDVNRLALVTDQLQEGVKQARMLPLATLVANFRRMVRDLAREKGVEVLLEVEGADTEMDKQVLEQLKDPLMHLLRNCIDHAIEPPRERSARGKSRQGHIALRAERRGNEIVLEVADDGAGIDTAAVREAALRRGLIDEDAARSLSEEELQNLVFAPGLSTAKMITEVSGRGIGLDVVRRNLDQLQGRVEVHSIRGRGTRFALTVPFTMVSTRCLLLTTGGQIFAVPVGTIERLLSVRAEDVCLVEGREAIRYHGTPLALVRLADVLSLQRANGLPAPAIILTSGGERIAFLAEQLLGEQELVVKHLGRQLARVANIAGATILGTGEVVLILNVADLVRSAQKSAGPSLLAEERTREKAAPRQRILIVDDSITTRTLEKNILTTAGYEVRLALDGQEALAALAEGPVDLVVSDIDMPRMDGFDLTHRLKNDDRYADLPVILVTSMGSGEDKARGIEVGADAYIVKGSFDQDVLLETIRQLI